MVARAVEQQDTRWRIEALALDREAGPATFNIAQSNQFSSLHAADANQPARFAHDNSLARAVSVTRATMAVELAKWQAIFGFKRPFLKMDTQGNDLAVVEGAGSNLGQFVGLQTELSFQRLYQGAPDFTEVLAVLRDKGFLPSAFVPNNDAHFPDLYEVDCILHNTGLP